ncbi:hypothetical protein JMA_25410 [Jeotgalibacillus malaysiensis]|uniref:Hydrolase n=1 Tax=Jeotgalibacillus malaysiensis TaxID=1508404 RepID=A0A0B5ATH2_9BACL|nr:hypothetical protein [Jeotgalibacillus malaysiensis]AJD91858.1 hypothetical protein JMA_25410 [Jeotgalibacillus malaysiensis]
MDQKNTYYVSVARREILRSGTDSPYEFIVNATDDEITKLRILFDRNEESEMEGFLTGQMPSVPYHVDRANQQSDNLLIKIYSLIGEIGDEEARNHIVTMGIKPPTEEHPFINRDV